MKTTEGSPVRPPIGAAEMTAPEHKIGDYLIVYCGQHEGCCFTVKDVRRAPANVWQPERWEYDTGSYGWRSERTVCTEQHARLYP